uniref:Beta-2-microglobulin n=1 Tax=Monopterus albus TaxID=43700 RepID=A0A3Q3JJ74_MONAL|nr:beta-2-microglobulin-like [Monopterus albus]
MKAVVRLVLLTLLILGSSMARELAPKVQVYSRKPGDFGKPNVLICHTTGFHPPVISIELLKNGQVIPGVRQTDLAFEENWHYHLTSFVDFIPKNGDEYTCKVTHNGKPKTYIWEPDV